MKIALASDLHLEFAPVVLSGSRDVDVLVLAGDICPVVDIKKHQAFFERCSTEFKEVIWVAGNHEYYHGEFFTTRKTMQKFAAKFKNFHYLENSAIAVGSTLFFGTTLWTDCNNMYPMTEIILKKYMYDFHVIKFGHRKILPADFYSLHKDAVKQLHEWMPDNTPMNVVVITHHLPHPLSIPPEFKNEFDMNGGFCTNLDDFIAVHPKINLWMHGHSHTPADYTIHQTRITSNPRGYYGSETNEINFQLKEIDLTDLPS